MKELIPASNFFASLKRAYFSALIQNLVRTISTIVFANARLAELKARLEVKQTQNQLF